MSFQIVFKTTSCYHQFYLLIGLILSELWILQVGSLTLNEMALTKIFTCIICYRFLQQHHISDLIAQHQKGSHRALNWDLVEVKRTNIEWVMNPASWLIDSRPKTTTTSPWRVTTMKWFIGDRGGGWKNMKNPLTFIHKKSHE